MIDISQCSATLTGIVAAIIVGGKFGGRVSGLGTLASFKGEPPLTI